MKTKHIKTLADNNNVSLLKLGIHIILINKWYNYIVNVYTYVVIQWYKLQNVYEYFPDNNHNFIVCIIKITRNNKYIIYLTIYTVF